MQTVVRKKPKNLQEADFYLFENAISLEIEEPRILYLTNIHILKDHIFRLRNLRFYSAYSHILNFSKTRRLKQLLWFLKPYRTVDQGIWVIDEWSAEYFHWLTDALSRLIAAESLIGNHSVLLPERYERLPYVQASLDILNIKAHYYNPRNRLVVKELILPSHTAPTGNYNIEMIQKLRERFMMATTIHATKKIYVSRRKANKRKVLNESDVVVLLLDYGYEVHNFEDYSFQDQISLMRQTKKLVGLHGAGLTNMLFMQEQGQILELRNEQDSHNNCFFSLASALNHDYYYLTNRGNTTDTSQVDITVDIAQLTKIIILME